MPNNENNYRINFVFASFLKGLPGFRITTESVGFANVEISQSYPYNQHSLIDQLFNELEKDYVDREELVLIGRIFKKYWLLLKQINIDRMYYKITPGLMAGLFIVLHLSLLFFPDNRILIYGSLLADLYGLGFWIFSVWSFNQHERVLGSLENTLFEKINFLKSLSFSMQMNPHYMGSSASILPSYEDVLREDATSAVTPTLSMTTSSNRSNFFYSSGSSNGCECDTDNTDPRLERCYSV